MFLFSFDWLSLLRDEMHGWFNLVLGVFMFFCIAMVGQIGKIGDWLFSKKDDN